MSLALYIVAEDQALQEEVFVNGKTVAHHWDHLGVLMVDAGNKHLDEYVEIAPPEDDSFLSSLPISEAERQKIREFEDTRWFDPIQGQAYVRELIRLVKQDSMTTPLAKQSILQDLHEYLTAFEVLVRSGCRWRFKFDL
ncbi:MAG: hypothetical protein HY913_23240 [Desulfomonile tiedjei]|nr:hypothetical protein [Desulfomonile tiedjei]